MPHTSRTHLALATLLSALSVSGCGGGNDALVGGAINGLGTGLSVTIQNTASGSTSSTTTTTTTSTSSSTEVLTLTTNGPYSFTTGLSSGASYSVSVVTQPTGQVCTVTNGSGSVDSNADNVRSVDITCLTSASLDATVTGLALGASVTLTAYNSGTTTALSTLSLSTNGTATFPGTLTTGQAYSVSVTQNPVGQTCTISNPTGSIVANTVETVSVSCI
jgi:phage tail sheath gpL-like